MNNPKITEAPWTVSDRSSSIKIVAPNGYVIASLYKEAGSPHILPNANIMAAAPDLFRELTKALETIKLLAEEANYQSARWIHEHIVPIEEVLDKANPSKP